MSPLNLIVGPTQQKKNPQEMKVVHSNINVAVSMAYIIAVPAIIFSLLGRYLDRYFDTLLYFPLCIAIGILLSGIGILWKTRQVIRERWPSHVSRP